MVMEAPPSPDSVGRELVRQYYTLMNKAPDYLHRFYNNQSSFLHGGLDPNNPETTPVIGQKQIHQKIQQLNFRDCHAKISQVDSQATLGNGVVVQVTGELSNAGQPMRRFTQTFVLAAQSPKKYYVHNDIFRYQDEIVSEEDCETETRSDVDDDLGVGQEGRPALGEMPPQMPPQQQQQQQQQPPPPMAAYYAGGPPPATAGGVVPGAMAAQAAPPPPPHHHSQQQQQVVPPPQHVMAAPQPAAPVPTVNGAIHPDEINVLPPNQVPPHVVSSTQATVAAATPMVAPLGVMAPQGMQPPPPQQHQVPGGPMSGGVIDPAQQQQLQQQQQVVPPPQQALVEEGAGDGPNSEGGLYGEDASGAMPATEAVDPPEAPIVEPIVSNEPKTYATLLKSGNNSVGGGGYGMASPAVGNVGGQQPSITPPPAQRSFDRDLQQSQQSNQGLGSNPRNPTMNNVRGGGNQPRVPRQDNRSGPGRQSDDDERRRSQGTVYGDGNQLFLGNLPHTATDDDLREIFSQFGTVVDLRIHSKQGKAGGGGGAVPGTRIPPNYGFITYDSYQAVKDCLAAKPIYFPDKFGTVLNVEEKKTKDRQYGGGGMGNNGGGPRPRDSRDARDNGGLRRTPGAPMRGGGLAGARPPGGAFGRGGGGPPGRNPNGGGAAYGGPRR